MTTRSESAATTLAPKPVNVTTQTGAQSFSRPKLLQTDLARIARFARQATGLSQPELAEAIGTQQQVISAQECGNQKHAQTIKHVAHGPVAYRRVVVRELAAIDGDIVDPSVEIIHATHQARNASIVTEATDVMREFAIALADNEVDRREAVPLLKQIRELKSALGEAEKALVELLNGER